MTRKKIGLLLPNLMDRSRFREYLQKNGYEVQVLASLAEASTFLNQNPEALLIIDFSPFKGRAGEIGQALGDSGSRVVGFYPHVETELADAIKKAGIHFLYPRSKFFQQFDSILQQFS